MTVKLTVKVIIPPNVESNKFPSDDAKKLVWGLKPDLSDLKESINIKKNSTEMLHVVFADSIFPSVPFQEIGYKICFIFNNG